MLNQWQGLMHVLSQLLMAKTATIKSARFKYRVLTWSSRRKRAWATQLRNAPKQRQKVFTDLRYAFLWLTFMAPNLFSKDKPFFLSTYFPAVLLALNGHSLEISISVCLEYIVVDNILQLDLRESAQSARTIQQLARTASALVECSRALDAKYKRLAHPVKPRHPHQPCFPRVTLHPSEASDAQPLPKLEFLGRLSRKNKLIEMLADPEPSDMQSLLVADMDEGKDKDRLRVVVKFVDNYSQVAHEMLANDNLAPKLYHCRRVLGDMLIVIMEHLEGWKPMDQFHKGDLSSSVFQDVEKALEKLGENGLVHGDLRAVNIMVDATKQHAMIVDFDWTAIEGEGKYPLTINKAMLKDEWHSDVRGGGEMMREHDKYALDQVLKLKYK
jgi:hypothetical protein